jgi:serine/threonine protein phosphatase 1
MNRDGIWVIGDVHGEYDKLIELIDMLPKDANICFVGDLIDRGDSSSAVVDLVIENNWLCVLGNHELMMLDALKDSYAHEMWISYENNEVKLSHYDFVKTLPYFLHFEIDGHKPLVVSHSYLHHVWVNKGHEYCLYDGEDILWQHMYNTGLFDADKEFENGIFNIFGHTPKKEVVVSDTYAMVDTGAYYSKTGYGKLSAIHYPSMKLISTSASEL